MSLTKKINMKIEERYKEINYLTYFIKIDDPESETAVRRKAKIRSLKFIGILTVLVNHAGAVCPKRLIGMLAGAYQMLARVCMFDCLGEQRAAQKHLLKSLMITEVFGEDQYFALLNMTVQIMLAKAMMMEDLQGALSNLDKAENLYRKSKRFTPVEAEDMFVTSLKPLSKTNRNLFENNYVDISYIRAGIYKKMGDELKSAILTHVALGIHIKSTRFDHIYWIRKAIITSNIFIKYLGFKQARHVLAAAEYVLEKYSSYVRLRNDVELYVELARTKADLFEMWVWYGIELLRVSQKVKISDGTDKSSTDLAQSDLENTAATKEEIEGLIFMKLKIVKYQNQITDELVETPLDARRIYKNIQKWLDVILFFYSDPACVEYVRNMLHRSESHLALALCEQDFLIQKNLFQKRIDVLLKLHSTIDQLSRVDLRKQIYQELSKGYCDLVDLAKGGYGNASTIPSENLINPYVLKSIENYRQFLNCFKNPETNEYPEKILGFEEEYNFLFAHVTIAFLHQELINPTSEELLQHADERKSMLRVVVDYCERHPDAQVHLNIEHIKYSIQRMYVKMYESTRKIVIPLVDYNQ